jgi:hypothetical protein
LYGLKRYHLTLSVPTGIFQQVSLQRFLESITQFFVGVSDVAFRNVFGFMACLYNVKWQYGNGVVPVCFFREVCRPENVFIGLHEAKRSSNAMCSIVLIKSFVAQDKKIQGEIIQLTKIMIALAVCLHHKKSAWRR